MLRNCGDQGNDVVIDYPSILICNKFLKNILNDVLNIFSNN